MADHGLSTNETTIAELLKTKGYVTGMAGKWHLGAQRQMLPIHHGFDEYLGLPYSNDMWPLHPNAKKGTYPDLPLIEGDKPVKVGLDHKDQEQLTTLYTERAVKFIEKNKNRPFFFYLAHNMPHVPLHVSDKFRGKSERGLYGDVIMEIDWSVGQVMEALKKNGLEQNTWIIFASDNGPWLCYGDHGGTAKPLREGKGTCFEGGTRVPCVMRWPGHIPSGQTNDAMLMTIDLLPTIASIVGADLPKRKIDGANVLPVLTARTGATNPHAAYYSYYEVGALHAVTSGDGEWKLHLPHKYWTLNGRPGGTNGVPVRHDPGHVDQLELYNLRADISEQKNVAAENPDIVKRLLAFAEEARNDLGDKLVDRKGNGIREPEKAEAAAK
jgi:arylsulfatase